MLYSDRYDRSGKLWKFMDQLGFFGKGANISPETYILDYLQKHGY